MAISLKRYEPQVGISAETGLQPISASTASAMVQAAGAGDQLISDTINMLGDKAVDFFEHKAKGEVAKYEAYKQEWANDLEIKKQEALLNGGLKATELYDKVVVPEQQSFESWVKDQDFSRIARQQIEPDVANFGKKVNASERLNLIQLQIEESNFSRMEEAQSYDNAAYQAQKDMDLLDPSTEEYKQAESIYNLNIQKAEDIYTDLKRTTKIGAVDEIRSTRRYNRYNLEIASTAEALALGQITAKQYSEDINKTRQILRNDELLSDSQKSTLDSQLTYKIAGVANTLAKKSQQVEKDIVRDVNSEEGLTQADLNEARIVYGDEAAEQINDIVKSSFLQVAISNEDVAKLAEKIQELPSSPDSYVDFVAEASKVGGKYAELSREVAAIIMSEITDEDATIGYTKINPTFNSLAYSGAMVPIGAVRSEPETLSVDYNGWVKGVHQEIIEFTKFLPIETSEEVNKFISVNEGMLKQLVNYYYENPNPSDEQLQQLRTKMFGGLAADMVKKTTVPTLQAPTANKDKKDSLGIL